MSHGLILGLNLGPSRQNHVRDFEIGPNGRPGPTIIPKLSIGITARQRVFGKTASFFAYLPKIVSDSARRS
jgi:hypothetical protein